MNELIKLLRKRNLLSKNGPKTSTIDSLSSTKVIDLFAEIGKVVTANQHPVKNSVFSFSASLGLGGSSLECRVLSCRLNRINILARFALLYGDEVYISNFLTDYDIKSITEENVQFVKENLYDDLLVLQEIRPLLEQGYIKFFEPQRDICFSCHADQFLGKNAHKRFSEEYKRLRDEFLANMNVKCDRKDDQYHFTCDGPFPYFDHDLVCTYDNIPKELAAKPYTVLRRVQKGEITQLSKTLIKSLGLHTEMAHLVATNAMHGLATSGSLKTSFLTENDLHISFLNSLHYDPEIRERNSVALKYLESMVPFVEDVALKEIIKLRQREEEAFVIYRQALNLAIDKFANSGAVFTEKDARTLHADVIAPSLALLDRKIKQAKRDLISKPLRSFVGVVGAVSFGLLTGLISSNISAIAQTVGLVKFSADVIENVMSFNDREKDIKNDQFYFLWKIKKARK